MNIRTKILIYISSTVIALLAISLILVYVLFARNREEQFQQQQKQKIKYTVSLINEYKEMSAELSRIMDKQDIHDFYDEKMLIFDDHKDVIFSSIDDLPIQNYEEILNALSPSNIWIETKDGPYDLIGIYLENNSKAYYAISKAYDAYGYSKLYYLRNMIIGIFVIFSIIVVLVSLLLANRISKPITALAENLYTFDFNSESSEHIVTDNSSKELRYLTSRFNEMLQKTRKAFAFQKHIIQHISHELKTPVAILVSELEKTKKLTQDEKLQTIIDNQLNTAKSLGEIITVLLEISKIESGQKIVKQPLRIDEQLFDCMEELKNLHPGFYFEVFFIPDVFDENRLVLYANKMLLRRAFANLLTNCISYSSDQKAEIKIDCSAAMQLKISFINHGLPVTEEESKKFFSHFFRGENSRNKTGFGLGLVLAQKIIGLMDGTIEYRNPAANLNIFEVTLPLS